MGKWLAKFLEDYYDSLPDKPDIPPSVSGMSVSDPEDSPKTRGGETEADAMIPPLSPGWFVVYRNSSRLLCGGFDDSENGTVQACLWENGAWTVRLTSGTALPLRVITAVGQTAAGGHLISAWTVREHGYDGQGKGHE